MAAYLLDTALTRAFGLDVPVVQAPVGGVAGPELVAAVAECGALGVLPIWFFPVETAIEKIRQTAAKTNRAFAVNLRADMNQHDHLSAAIGEGVSSAHLFWGDPAPYGAALRSSQTRMIVTVSDADTAKAALDAGAHALIAQGYEAGGHVYGTTPLEELAPLVAEQAGDVPVIAAGGIVDAADIRRAMVRGAAGAALGTRFVASEEANAHDGYKQAIIDAGDSATVMSLCFDDGWPDAPHRTLKNSTFLMWDKAERPKPGERPGEGEETLIFPDGRKLARYAVTAPTKESFGDWEAAALYAGTGAGKIRDVLPVREIIEMLRNGLADAQ